MESARLRITHRHNSALYAIALMALGISACFNNLDKSKVKCAQKEDCPKGMSCVNFDPQKGYGTCGSASGNQDGSAGGTSTSKPDAMPGASWEAGGGRTGGTGGAGSSGTIDASGGTGGTIVVGSPDAGTTPDVFATGSDAPAAVGNGSPCTVNEECSSGQCVDGLCCDKPCSGCNACTNAMTGKDDGTCAAVLVGQDPHQVCDDETETNECGNDGTCDGNGACRKVGTNHVCAKASCSSDGKVFTPAATCDGKGRCVPPDDKSCGQFKCALTGCQVTCDPSANPSTCDKGSYCDATSKICVAQKPNGQTASQASECVSGIIADGVCCNEVCNGCKACTPALNGQAANTIGQCMAVKAGNDDPHKTCVAEPPCGLDGKCDGNGSCRYVAANTSCGSDSCVGSSLSKNACDSTHKCTKVEAACPGLLLCASASTCKPSCTGDTDCVANHFCASGICKPKVADGGACTGDGQCQNGNCVAGTCCHTPCSSCHSCSTGVCKTEAGCSSGQFCSNDTQCKACTTCGTTQYQSAACTATTDTQCTDCSPCGSGKYQTAACSATTNTSCATCSTCGANQYQTAACTATTNTQCANCSTCGANQYQTAACTATTNTACANCTTCASNQYQAAACSATANTQCANCSSCGSNQYQTSACSASANTQCANCTTCSSSQYRVSACSATANTVCANCTTCGANQYQTTACSTTANTVCANCAPCGANQYQSAACGGTSNTQCANCTTCGANQYRAAACTPTSNTVCQPCSTCGAGKYPIAACTPTADTQCATVPAGMTWIPGGTFTSGDTIYQTNYTSNIAGFLLDTAPVTMSAYATCVQNGYCTTNTGGGDNCNGLYDSSRSNNPANCVSYQQAYWYCNSVGKRLPTEWEFEYAGRYPDRRIWPWGNTEPGATSICWAYPTFNSRESLGTCPVGQRPGTSSLGLIDMVGNVGVWTDSWYCDTPPCSSGITRVIRGNGYSAFESTAVRLAGQNTQFPDYAADWVGIRCAKSP